MSNNIVWTRVCSMCGAVVSLREWESLPFVGYQDDGCGGLLELRNHHCLTTLSRPVPADTLPPDARPKKP